MSEPLEPLRKRKRGEPYFESREAVRTYYGDGMRVVSNWNRELNREVFYPDPRRRIMKRTIRSMKKDIRLMLNKMVMEIINSLSEDEITKIVMGHQVPVISTTVLGRTKESKIQFRPEKKEPVSGKYPYPKRPLVPEKPKLQQPLNKDEVDVARTLKLLDPEATLDGTDWPFLGNDVLPTV